MTTIASFNVKNLIGPDQEYYEFQRYTPEEYNWKRAWLADQLVRMNADVVGFQEIFEEDALRDVIARADEKGVARNALSIPGDDKPYGGKKIFQKLSYDPYAQAALAFAPNVADGGEPGKRRPGLAILSRHGFADSPRVVQDLDVPLTIPFAKLRGMEGDTGQFTLHRLSRPVLIARVPMGGRVVTVFNCHLKSKLGELLRPEGADYPPAADLTNYDPLARAIGSLRAALRRMAEAAVLRDLILAELKQDRPVVVMGDLNDGDTSVSTEIIQGETPFKNYAWMLRHDAKHPNDRYSHDEARHIHEDVDRVRLRSAEKLFVAKSLRDVVFTSVFGGNYESIDQILLSRHFDDSFGGHIASLDYFTAFNDHLTDGSHPEAPYNKLASDHGQIVAHLAFKGDDT